MYVIVLSYTAFAKYPHFLHLWHVYTFTVHPPEPLLACVFKYPSTMLCVHKALGEVKFSTGISIPSNVTKTVSLFEKSAWYISSLEEPKLTNSKFEKTYKF